MTMPAPRWHEILDEIEQRYGSGIVGLRAEEREIRFENRDDESAFRLFRTGPVAKGHVWRLEERVAGQVVRAGSGRSWWIALDRYDRAVESGEAEVGP
jgi:hypothetical protein